MNRRTFQKRH